MRLSPSASSSSRPRHPRGAARRRGAAARESVSDWGPLGGLVTRLIHSRSVPAGVTRARLRGGTRISSWSTAMPRASSSASPPWRPSWSVSTWTSSWSRERAPRGQASHQHDSHRDAECGRSGAAGWWPAWLSLEATSPALNFARPRGKRLEF